MNSQYYLILYQPVSTSVVSPTNFEDLKKPELKFYEKPSFIGLAVIVILLLLIMK